MNCVYECTVCVVFWFNNQTAFLSLFLIWSGWIDCKVTFWQVSLRLFTALAVRLLPVMRSSVLFLSLTWSNLHHLTDGRCRWKGQMEALKGIDDVSNECKVRKINGCPRDKKWTPQCVVVPSFTRLMQVMQVSSLSLSLSPSTKPKVKLKRKASLSHTHNPLGRWSVLSLDFVCESLCDSSPQTHREREGECFLLSEYSQLRYWLTIGEWKRTTATCRHSKEVKRWSVDEWNIGARHLYTWV